MLGAGLVVGSILPDPSFAASLRQVAGYYSAQAQSLHVRYRQTPACRALRALTNPGHGSKIGDSAAPKFPVCGAVHPSTPTAAIHILGIDLSVTVLLQSNLGPVPLLGRGKVRDLYAVDGALLLVATDRISAFDHVLASGIPGKGKILTQISLFWFDLLRELVPNHLITASVSEYPASLHPYADQLAGRSMLVKRAAMFPVECVARGYLAGSGWKEYQQSATVCGIPLPHGLLDGSRLAEPVFTPATKSQDGAHDENISFDAMEKIVGAQDAAELRRLTLAIYRRASGHAESRGLILADTKFEFGRIGEGIILADEVLTPDSSRFWEAQSWKPGGAQPSFDKQYVRDYLESIRWNKQAPAPGLPDEVVERTLGKYLDAFHRLTGSRIQL